MRFIATAYGAIPYGPDGQIAILSRGGGAAIVKGNTLDVLSDPIANLSQIAFSSWDFDYFAGAEELSTTISLPSRASNSSFVDGTKTSQGYAAGSIVSGTSDYFIGNHSRNQIPAFIAHIPSLQRTLSSTTIFAIGDSARFLTVVPTSNELWLCESFCISQSSLPAMSIDIKVLIFEQTISSSYISRANIALMVLPERIILGNGKIDTKKQYFTAYFNNTSFGNMMNTKPSLVLEQTSSCSTNSYGRGPVSSVRLSNYQNGVLAYSVQGSYGNWGTRGSAWPYKAYDGNTISFCPK